MNPLADVPAPETPEPPPPAPPRDRAWDRCRRALAWRGPDGTAAPLSRWFLAIALLAGALALVPGTAGFCFVAPFSLALAVLVPTARAVAPSLRLWLLRRRWRWIEPVLVGAILAALTLLLFGHVLRGTPVDHNDHEIFMARARLLYEGFAQHHRLVRWTHLWQGGDSNTDLYPTLFSWIVVAIHAVRPRGASFQSSYGLAVIALWWLRGLASYHLARRFARPPVAVVLTIFSLFDVGRDVWDGIWNGTFYWGMVHNNLAVTLGMFAVAAGVDAYRHVTGRRLVVCGLLTALAAFAHPLGLMYVGVLLPAPALAAFLRGARRRALWMLTATVVGLALAAAWIIPNGMALHQHSYSFARSGYTIGDMGVGLLQGTHPASSFGGFLGFLALGLIAGALSRRPLVAGTAVGTLVLIFIGISPLAVELRLFELAPGLLDTQPTRMMTLAKTALIPCLAWLLSRLRAPRWRPSGDLHAPAVLWRALVIALLGLGPLRLAGSAGERLWLDLEAQIPEGTTRTWKAQTNPDWRAAFAWLAVKRKEDKSPTPWRLAYLRPPGPQHPAWSSGLDTGVPLVEYDDISSNLLAYRPREITLQGFRDWNIRYVMTAPDKAPLPELVSRFTAGQYQIWEVPDADDHLVRAPEGVKISDMQVEPDRIRFKVAGVAPGQTVPLHVRVAWFPRWEAHEDGRRVPLVAEEPHAGAVPRQDQLGVRAGNGEVLLSCTAPMPGAGRGWIISILGLVALAPLSRRRVRARAEALVIAAQERIAGVARARRRLWIPVAIVVSLVVLVVAARAGTRRLRVPLLGGRGLAMSFLPRAGASARCHPNLAEGGVVCFGPAGPIARASAALGWGSVPGNAAESPKHWPGVRVTSTEAGLARLRFARVALGRRELRINFRSNHPTAVKVLVEGETLATWSISGAAEKRLALPRTAPRTGAVTLELELPANDELMFSGLSE